MGIRKILIEPDPILRQKSLEVKTVDKDLQNLMDDMLLTMYSAPGIGLAAIQVGVPKRVIVMDLSRQEEKKNPNYDKERTEKLRDQWIKASKKAGTWTQENEDKIMAIQLSAKSVPAFMPTPWK